MLRIHSFALAAAVAVTLTACADSPNVTTPVAGAPSNRTAIQWANTYIGTTGPGADYAIYVPNGWNGDVVYYAHGIKDVAEPVGLPTSSVAELRDSLGVMGYAVAYSSFSENGWAVKDGMQRTHQLRGLFASTAGTPRRSFVIGHSMGGLVALGLAETYPQQYDGALPMCGVVGGAQKEVDYIANVRTVFDFFYPGALPGDALDMPIELDLNTILGKAQGAILSDPDLHRAFAMARVAQTPLAWASVPELIQSILTGIAFDARGADDLLDRTHGHSPFDNSETVYTDAFTGQPILALNAGVKRFTETPDAANYLAKYYQPTGDLRIPTVSIHTTRDPVVPIFHEGLYAGLANAQGANGMLLQRSISRYGHCTFAIGEMTSAFRTLAGWVATGVRPAL